MWPRARETRLERNYAPATNTILTATTVPLISSGLTSDIYKGTIKEAIPTPIPTINLPIIRDCTLYAKNIMSWPIAKRISAIKITVLLPILSEIGPADREPKHAPAPVSETILSI